MVKYLVFFLAGVSAASAGTLSLTVDGAATYALKHNSDLEVARARLGEAEGRLLGAGRLSNPELETEFNHNLNNREKGASIGLKQRFPLTARLRLEKAASRADLAAAQAEIRDAERRLVAEVRTVAVRVLALRSRAALRQAQIANSSELSRFVSQKVSTGESSSIEAAQVGLETNQLEIDALLVRSEEAALLAQLRLLLGGPAVARLDITGELRAPGRGLPAYSASAPRADLEASQHASAAAEATASLARAGKWEDIEVGLTAGWGKEEDAPEGYEDNALGGVRVSVPLPLWNKNEGRVRETTATLQRTKKETTALANRIQAEAAGAREEAQAIAKVVASIDRDLLPAAIRLEEQLREYYSSGQASLPDVLKARAQRIGVEAQRLDILRDYHLALIRYQAALGSFK